MKEKRRLVDIIKYDLELAKQNRDFAFDSLGIECQREFTDYYSKLLIDYQMALGIRRTFDRQKAYKRNMEINNKLGLLDGNYLK